jgi:hypothetical protein
VLSAQNSKKMRNTYQILDGKPERKEHLRPRHRWESKMDHKKIGCECVDWILVAGSCEHGNEPMGSAKDRKFLDKLSKYQLLKRDLLHEGN